MQFVLSSACVCRRPSWTPKTQPGGSSAATSLSFWCSTRLLMSVKKCISYRRKTCNGDSKFFTREKKKSLPENFKKIAISSTVHVKIKKPYVRNSLPWKTGGAREELQKNVRESGFLSVKKVQKHPKLSFTHTFDFHAGKKTLLQNRFEKCQETTSTH